MPRAGETFQSTAASTLDMPPPAIPQLHLDPTPSLQVRSETKTNAIAFARIPQAAMSLSLELFGQFTLYTHQPISFTLRLCVSVCVCVGVAVVTTQM